MDAILSGDFSRIRNDQTAIFILSAVIGGIVTFLFFVCATVSKKPSDEKTTDPEEEDWKEDQVKKPEPKQPKKTEAKLAPITAVGPENPLFQGRLKGFKNAIDSAVFSADGRYLAVCNNERVVRVYFADTLKEKDHRNIQVNMQDDNAIACDFSSTGNDMIVGLADKQRIAAYQILEKKGPQGRHYQLKADFPTEHKHPLKKVLLAPSAAYIVSISSQTEVLVWNLQGKVIERIDTKQVQNFCGAISPDSRFFAIGCWTSEVKIWEALYDKKTNMFGGIRKGHVMDLKGHKRGVTSLAFSPDGKRIATASLDGTWKMWSIDVRYDQQEDPKLLFTSSSPQEGASFSGISFSPDGSIVATSKSNNIQFWSAADGNFLEEVVNSHSKAVSSLSWHKTGILATGSHDMTVGLWKAPSL